MRLSILPLGVSLLASFPLALAHPAAPASPTSSSSFLVPLPLTLPLPNSDSNHNHITGNFSHSCDQITLMNQYFLAATCSPIEPVPVPAVVSCGSEGQEGEEQVDGKQHVPSPAEEFNQLDLNMCIGFDQGSGDGNGIMIYTPGKLIWQVLGKFANYCTDCNLTTGPDQSKLRCSCVPMTAGSGATVTTVLDLDEGVENRNGTLVCRGGMGSGIGPGPLPA